MIQFDYDDILNRHEVCATSVVASISEDNKLTIHKEEGLDIAFVRQILMQWDELSHQLEMKDKREAGDFDELLNNKQKGE